MAGRGEEVAGAMEAKVRESIEKIVTDIRSSIEDVQKAVNQQLQAALQSVQADANSVSLGKFFSETITQLEDSMSTGAPQAVAPAAAAGGGNAVLIKRSIQAVEKGKTQVDVLNALLEQTLNFGTRAALLILKGDSFSGWKGLGFSAHGGNDEQVKRFTAGPNAVAELDDLLRNEHVVSVTGGALSSKFNASAPSRAVLVPMVIKDKVAAAVYVDAVPGEEDRFDRASIELLVFTTGLLIDTLAIRKKIPSPTLSVERDEANETVFAIPPPPLTRPAPTRSAPSAAPVSPVRPAAPLAPKPSARPVSEPTVAIPAHSFSLDPAPGHASRGFELEQPAKPKTSRSAPEFDLEDLPVKGSAPAPAAANAFSTTVLPAFGGATAAPPARPAAPPVAAKAASDLAARPSTQYIPPPGAGRSGGMAGQQTEEGKKHDEARRFARLLVSEIKLYNESKVEQGRKNRDIYERLKEDIDRSRQMYDERIAEDVRKASNYFYDELVRILAEGDRELLGL